MWVVVAAPVCPVDGGGISGWRWLVGYVVLLWRVIGDGDGSFLTLLCQVVGGWVVSRWRASVVMAW